MPKISIRQVLAFAGLHVVVLTMVFVLALATLPMFDEDWSPSMLGRITEVLLGVLVMPGWAMLMIMDGGSAYSVGLEWTVLALNSLVWGVALAFLRVWWLQRKQA